MFTLGHWSQEPWVDPATLKETRVLAQTVDPVDTQLRYFMSTLVSNKA